MIGAGLVALGALGAAVWSDRPESACDRLILPRLPGYWAKKNDPGHRDPEGNVWIDAADPQFNPEMVGVDAGPIAWPDEPWATAPPLPVGVEEKLGPIWCHTFRLWWALGEPVYRMTPGQRAGLALGHLTCPRGHTGPFLFVELAETWREIKGSNLPLEIESYANLFERDLFDIGSAELDRRTRRMRIFQCEHPQDHDLNAHCGLRFLIHQPIDIDWV